MKSITTSIGFADLLDALCMARPGAATDKALLNVIALVDKHTQQQIDAALAAEPTALRNDPHGKLAQAMIDALEANTAALHEQTGMGARLWAVLQRWESHGMPKGSA